MEVSSKAGVAQIVAEAIEVLEVFARVGREQGARLVLCASTAFSEAPSFLTVRART
jgi:hypothetical protein